MRVRRNFYTNFNPKWVWSMSTLHRIAGETNARTERWHELHFTTHNAALRVTHSYRRHRLGHA